MADVPFRSRGEDVFIAPQSLIKRPELVSIGSHVSIDAFVVITTQAEIGSYVHIAYHCAVIGGAKSKLVMEDHTNLATGTRVICGSDDFTGTGLIKAVPAVPDEMTKVNSTTVTIKRFAAIGTNVVIHPGVTIGEGAVVGSCSLVTQDLEPWGIYTGVPARKTGERKRDAILKYHAELNTRK
jgi:galactoside O-acetyltransferase